MPIDYRKYPKNWKTEIRPRILSRANNCCEFCGLKNGQSVYRFRVNSRIGWFQSMKCCPYGAQYLGIAKVVLTIAHLDHDESNELISDDRLSALCQKCHLSYDYIEKRRRITNGEKYVFKPKEVLNLDGEIWRQILGYEELYEVSNMARVKSLSELSASRNRSILSQHNHKKGYKLVSLWDGKNQKTFKVHRLVAIAFIPNPLNLPVVNHKFGVVDDNRVSQLEWTTYGRNQEHAYEIGLKEIPRGIKNGKNILSEEDVLYIFNSCEPQSALMKKYNVSKSCISHIQTGYTWSHLTSTK